MFKIKCINIMLYLTLNQYMIMIITRKFDCIQIKDVSNEEFKLFQNYPNLSKIIQNFSKFIQYFSNDKII